MKPSPHARLLLASLWRYPLASLASPRIRSCGAVAGAALFVFFGMRPSERFWAFLDHPQTWDLAALLGGALWARHFWLSFALRAQARVFGAQPMPKLFNFWPLDALGAVLIFLALPARLVLDADSRLIASSFPNPQRLAGASLGRQAPFLFLNLLGCLLLGADIACAFLHWIDVAFWSLSLPIALFSGIHFPWFFAVCALPWLAICLSFAPWLSWAPALRAWRPLSGPASFAQTLTCAIASRASRAAEHVLQQGRAHGVHAEQERQEIDQAAAKSPPQSPKAQRL